MSEIFIHNNDGPSVFTKNEMGHNDPGYELIQFLLKTYDHVMHLFMYVDNDDEELKQKYIDAAYKHNKNIVEHPEFIDAGFDLFAPGNKCEIEKEHFGDTLRFFGPGWTDISPVNTIDFSVCCSAKIYTGRRGTCFNSGYYMYPRSSLSKTQLRLANSTGIIDAGYRGHLMGKFDVVNKNPKEEKIDCDFSGKKYDRYVQICAPNLAPIVVTIVHSKDQLGDKTQRGSGGFGSTGR